jgi:cation diffusion facilitator family transporter
VAFAAQKTSISVRPVQNRKYGAGDYCLSIFFTGYEIVRRAVLSPEHHVVVKPIMLAGVGVAILVPFLFSYYEIRVGRRINSPSLIADATEFRAHIFSSGLVFVAVGGQLLGVHLDRYAAILIVLWISYEGWHTLVDAMRVLLDASIDPETLERVRRLILAHPSVDGIKSLTGRNSGRYRFLEAEIYVKANDLVKAHQITDEIEQHIRAQVPFVERILIHTEPSKPEVLRVAVPLREDRQTLSPVGNAAYFAFYVFRKTAPQPELKEVVPNQFDRQSRGRGIKMAQWLIDRHIHILISPVPLEQKGFAYALKAYDIQIAITRAKDVRQALEEIAPVK